MSPRRARSSGVLAQPSTDVTVQDLQEKLAEAKSNGRADRRTSIIVACLGAVALVAVPVVNAVGQARPAVSCADERSKAVTFALAHPKAWVPLKSDDQIEKLCEINAVVAKAIPTP